MNMSKMDNQSNQLSIHDYLDLPHRTWFVEFEISDFGASLPSILELPPKIYELDKKMIFWSFLKEFLLKCKIGFILRKYTSHTDTHEDIELALLGGWENKQIAIPLWILQDVLLGFEVITPKTFLVLDSEPLKWNSPVLNKQSRCISQNKQCNLEMYDSDLFQNRKLNFKINRGRISLSEHYNELEFFERIAQTLIPELHETPDE